LISIPEEMLLDLAQSEGIPDVLVTFQSAFKLLIEQLKKLSEKASQSSADMQEFTSKVKIEFQERFSRQAGAAASLLAKLLSKAIHQMLITKFESLSTGTPKDQKQLSSIMQHYVQYSVGVLLHDFQETLRPLVGESLASELSSSLKKQLYDQSTNMVGNHLSLSTIGFGKQSKDCSSQTSSEGLQLASKEVQMVSKSAQCIGFSQSVKSQFVQVDDLITAKKIELLMTANKKMSEQMKAFKDHLDDKTSKLDLALQRASAADGKLAETEQQVLKERAQNEKLKSALDQLTREHKQSVDKAREAESSVNHSVMEVVERAKKESAELKEQLQDLGRSANNQIEGLKKKLENTINELEIEKKANSQLQESLSQEIQSSQEINSLLQESNRHNSQLSLQIEDLKKSVLKAKEELKTTKEESSQHIQSLMDEQESLKNRLNLELSDTENQKQKSIERLSEKITELTAELAQQSEHYNQKVEFLASSASEMEQELDSKDKMIRELQAANNVLSDEKWSLSQLLEGLRNEYQHEKKQQEADNGKKSRQEEEFKRMKDKLTESGYRVRDLEKENNSLKEARSHLATKIEQLELTLAEVQQNDKEAKEIMESQLEDFDRRENEKNDMIDQLESSNTQLLAEIATLKRETEEMKMNLKEKEELNMSQISSYEKRIEALSKNLEDESSVRHQLAAMQEEISRKDRAIIQLEHMGDQSKRQNSDLNQQLEAYSGKISMVEDALKKLVEENTQLTSTLKATAEKMKQQQHAIEQLQDDKRSLEETADLQLQEIEQLKGQAKQDEMWESKLSGYMEELEEVRTQLTQKTALAEELSGQLQAANLKINERTSLLKKANEEYQALEKESIELRPMKKELVNNSIQLSKLKEDLQHKEKTSSKLASEVDQLKTQLLEKCKEAESISGMFKKTLEDFRKYQEQTTSHQEEEKKKWENTMAHEIEVLKASHAETVAGIKLAAEAQLQLKDAKIQQLLSSIDSKSVNTENEKNEIIANLQAKIAQVQDAERQASLRHTAEVTDLVSKYKEELMSAKKKSLGDLEKVQTENSVLSLRLGELTRDAKTKVEDAAQMKQALDDARKTAQESDDRLAELKDLLQQREKVITELFDANKVLTNTLKSIKRQQNSVPKAQSNQKTDASGVPGHPPVPLPQAHKIVISSSTERRVEHNLISNFEKHLTATTSNTTYPNPVAQYLNNKENSDNSNHVGYVLNPASAPLKKYTREEYEKVLAERKMANEANISPNLLLKPPLLGAHSNVLAQAHLSPSKPQGLLTSSIGGLHMLPEENMGGDNGDQRYDEGAKGYSSRYSRNSRTSRNSRRSPTPSKEHSSVH
jgi:chromosome segregation ATPase